MQEKCKKIKTYIYISKSPCRVRLGEISSHLNCHVSVLLLRSCAFWCRTTGFHQEASRCIPFPKLESYHRGKKTRSPDHHVTSYKLPAVAFSSFCSWQKTWNRICIYIYVSWENSMLYITWIQEVLSSTQILKDLRFCLQDFVQVEQQKRRPCENIQRPPNKKTEKNCQSIHPSIHQSIKHTFRHLRATKKIEHQITFQVYCYVLLL